MAMVMSTRRAKFSDRFRLAKQQLCTCITYISLPSLHNYNMELFNVMFCGTYAPCKRMQHCWPTTPNIVGATVLGVVVLVCTAAINTSPWNEHFVLLFSKNQLDSEITKISIDIAVISRNHAVKMRMRCFKPMMDSN